MELRQLRYFCEAAKCEHFSSAADALFVSQPALSRTIKNLEEELNVPLFEPKGRGVQLTPYGKYFHEVAQQALESLDDASRKLLRLSTSSSITISIINDIPELFSHLLRAFFKDHPDIPVLESPMRDGALNFFESSPGAFLLSYHPYNSRTIHSKQLMQDAFVLLTPPDHLLAGRSSVELDQLHSFPHVGHSTIKLPRLIEKKLAHPKYLVSDLLSVARLVSQGYGVSVIPASSWFLLQPDLDTFFPAETRPKSIPIVCPGQTATIYISYPMKPEYLPHEQIFLSFCDDFFSNLQKQLEIFKQTKFIQPF